MFPLNAVIFPGVSVPLNVFEDRYRALVHHLLRVEDPTQRLFGSVGIREGYEVGEHGSQSLFRVGCRVQLTEVEPRPDGTFSIVAVGLERIQVDRIDTSGTFLGMLTMGGSPFNMPYLWAIGSRTGGPDVDPNSLYITAGIGDEEPGLFAQLTPVPEPSSMMLMALLMTLWHSRPRL